MTVQQFQMKDIYVKKLSECFSNSSEVEGDLKLKRNVTIATKLIRSNGRKICIVEGADVKATKSGKIVVHENGALIIAGNCSLSVEGTLEIYGLTVLAGNLHISSDALVVLNEATIYGEAKFGKNSNATLLGKFKTYPKSKFVVGEEATVESGSSSYIDLQNQKSSLVINGKLFLETATELVLDNIGSIEVGHDSQLNLYPRAQLIAIGSWKLENATTALVQAKLHIGKGSRLSLLQGGVVHLESNVLIQENSSLVSNLSFTIITDGTLLVDNKAHCVVLERTVHLGGNKEINKETKDAFFQCFASNADLINAVKRGAISGGRRVVP